MMTDSGAAEFPIVYSLNARPSDDEGTLLVEATGFDDTIVRFAIPVDNVKHVIAFLLVWVATIGGGDASRDGSGTGEDESTLPIPATSIAVGAPNGSEGYLGISVGRAELVFALPLSVFGPLGQSLMMASASSALSS
jgi:hypothetical protein